MTGGTAGVASLAVGGISVLVQMTGRWTGRRWLRAVAMLLAAVAALLLGWAAIILPLTRVAVFLALAVIVMIAATLGFVGFMAETRQLPVRDVLDRCFPQPKGGGGE